MPGISLDGSEEGFYDAARTWQAYRERNDAMPTKQKPKKEVPMEPDTAHAIALRCNIAVDGAAEDTFRRTAPDGGVRVGLVAVYRVLAERGWLRDPAEMPKQAPPAEDPDMALLAKIAAEEAAEQAAEVFLLPTDPPNERGFVIVMRGGKMVKVACRVRAWRAVPAEIHYVANELDIETAEVWNP